MPAERSGSIHRNRSHPFPNDPTDVINFSSSERDDILPVQLSKRKENTRLKPKKPFTPSGEVIEISSDDDSPSPARPTSTIRDLRKQLQKMKEENLQYKRDFEKARRELAHAQKGVEELKLASHIEPDKTALDISQLEDKLTCEICTLWMWAPHILPECGHTYCQSCLQDWFSTTLATFMQTHPDYSNRRNRYGQQFQMLHNCPQLLFDPRVVGILDRMLPPQPQYTCPTCRVPVRVRPAEDFALKSLVTIVAAAKGDQPPPKEVTRRNLAGKGHLSPWDGFFPHTNT